MSKIAVMSDTGSNISVLEGKENGIYILPLQIMDGETEYHDLVDIDTARVYDLLREGKELKTSSPTMGTIFKKLEGIKNDGYDTVIYVPLTKGLSSTSATTYSVAQEVGIDLYIVDCYSTVYMQKYITYKIKELVDASWDVQKILETMEEHLTHSDTVIVVPDLTTLKRGGRVTPSAAALAGMLKIVPVLTLNKASSGVIDTYKKVRTEKKAVTTAIDYINEQIINKDNAIIGIVHSECDHHASTIKEAFIAAGVKEENIHITEMNSVISCHTGLGVIGIQYFDDVKA